MDMRGDLQSVLQNRSMNDAAAKGANQTRPAMPLLEAVAEMERVNGMLVSSVAELERECRRLAQQGTRQVDCRCRSPRAVEDRRLSGGSKQLSLVQLEAALQDKERALQASEARARDMDGAVGICTRLADSFATVLNKQLRDALAQARHDLIGAEQLIHTREADLAASVCMAADTACRSRAFQTHDRQRVSAQLYSGEVNNAQVIAELRNSLSTAAAQRDSLVRALIRRCTVQSARNGLCGSWRRRPPASTSRCWRNCAPRRPSCRPRCALGAARLN